MYSGHTSANPCQHIFLIVSGYCGSLLWCSNGPQFVHNKYFLSLCSTPTFPVQTLLISHVSVTISSFVVSPHWPSLPSPWGTASLMTSTVVSQQSSALCTNISITSTSPPLSPFLSWAKNTFSQAIHVANDHLQSSLLHPLSPSPLFLIIFIFCPKSLETFSRLLTEPPRCSQKIPTRVLS